MKTRIYSSILFLSVALVSCDNLSENISQIKKGTIGFSKPQISNVMTKAVSDEAVLVGKVESDDISFSVTCQEGVIDSYVATKAGTEINTSNLDSFGVHGFLGSEIDRMQGASDADKNNHHFIDGVSAGTTDHRLWHFASEQKWRNGVNHTFWAYYPESLDLAVNSDYSEATFSYTQNDFDTDVIISNAKRYYGKEEEDASTRKDALDLAFYHALAAVTANTNNVSFLAPDEEGGTPVVNPKRGEIVSVALRKLSKSGDCTVSGNGSTFGWSVSDDTAEDTAFGNNGLRFYMPQPKDNNIVVFTIKDNIREFTRPYTYDSLLGNGNWDAGKKYSYDIKGSVTFPYVNSSTPIGIKLDFSGQAFDSKMAVEKFDVQYIKRIKLSWTGLPTGNQGNGTFAFVGFKEYEQKPVEDKRPKYEDYMSGNNETRAPGNTNPNPNLRFSFDFKKSKAEVGEVTISGGNQNAKCSCTIDVSDMDFIDIYAAYKGSNSSGTISWTLHDLTIEVLEWKE